jgi:hypothetical protein
LDVKCKKTSSNNNNKTKTTKRCDIGDDDFVYIYFIHFSHFIYLAVTVDGIVIHRNGLITGGPSLSENEKIWDEKDVDGKIGINIRKHQSVYLGQ